MLLFQERKKLRNILYSKATILVLLVVLVFVARGAWKIHEKALIARAERDKVARVLLEIEVRQAELQASLTVRRTDQGIEEEIRQKFTVARPWEEVVVIVDDSAKKGENGEAEGSRSLWERFLGFWK